MSITPASSSASSNRPLNAAVFSRDTFVIWVHISVNPFREEFCEIFRAKDKTTMKMYTCKKFLKKDGRKVRKAAKNEILILKM